MYENTRRDMNANVTFA